MSDKNNFSFTEMPAENQLFQLYYFEGEDEFLLKDALFQIMSKYPDAMNSDFNVTKLSVTKGIGASHIYAKCRELPFMSPVKLIVVDNIHKLSSSEKEKLLGYLSGSIPKTAVICLINNLQNIKGRTSSAAKKTETALKKLGAFIDCTVDDKKVSSWISEKFKELNFKISRDAVNLLKYKLSGDFWMVHEEIKKLSAYCWGKKEISASDVNAISSGTTSAQIYNITDSIIKGDSSGAIKSMYLFTENEDPPLSLLIYLKKFFKGLAETDFVFKKTNNVADTAKELKKHEFVVRKNLEAASKLSSNSYAKISDILAKTDYSYKQSANRRLIFESMIVALSSTFKRNR